MFSLYFLDTSFEQVNDPAIYSYRIKITISAAYDVEIFVNYMGKVEPVFAVLSYSWFVGFTSRKNVAIAEKQNATFFLENTTNITKNDPCFPFHLSYQKTRAKFKCQLFCSFQGPGAFILLGHFYFLML